MDKRSEEGWVAFLMQDRAQSLSPDFMKDVEDLPMQERNFDWVKPDGHRSSTTERKRREAVQFARASVGLEGFTVSDESEADARRFINGEIELDEFLKLGIERIRKA